MVVWSKQTISRMSLFFHQPVHFKIESTYFSCVNDNSVVIAKVYKLTDVVAKRIPVQRSH
ncbi:hypothetical protein Pan54_36580 [Rubinisphaera italica]|uniref:Uncharacterized protein n=1 Tax=Rubinisphaera italica TaxID=2527969 RepID=A0A5C5XID9_9PLAN|nr:hypothetical protein Pan54_36580 [Rubinisphaera italica]